MKRDWWSILQNNDKNNLVILKDWRHYQQVIKDLPKIINLLNDFEKQLKPYKHYASASETLFYCSENKSMLEAQLQFYKKKLENIKT